MRGGCLSQFVFWGNGLSSVEAWFSTALDIEEVLSGVGGDQLHVMVADVILTQLKGPFLNALWVGLGLPDWFRRTYFGLSQSGSSQVLAGSWSW